MTTKQAIAFALSHGCNIGRRRPGIYYVTTSEGGAVHEVEVAGKTFKCAVDWIAANRKAV